MEMESCGFGRWSARDWETLIEKGGSRSFRFTFHGFLKIFYPIGEED